VNPRHLPFCVKIGRGPEIEKVTMTPIGIQTCDSHAGTSCDVTYTTYVRGGPLLLHCRIHKHCPNALDRSTTACFYGFV